MLVLSSWEKGPIEVSIWIGPRQTTYQIDARLVIGRCFLLFSICVVPPIAAADVTGKVVSISDGDTVTILDGFNRQYKVRLAGIDAPEKGQPFGQRSKQTLSECAFGRWANVEGNKVDRYGRLVGKVHVASFASTGISDQFLEARDLI